jgi:formylglycine-generating enzyme required for sulfatase activity
MAELAGQIRNALERVSEDATEEPDSDADTIQVPSAAGSTLLLWTEEPDSDADSIQEKSRSDSEKQDSKQKKTNVSPNERSTLTIDGTLPKKDFENSIGIKFVLVQPGKFMMGSEEYEWEKPVHKVTISKPFYLGIYPVTQKEWKAIMGNNPSYFKGDNLPVESVSWNDVQEFIKKLNKKEGANKYRLPSEAEWEYAARAGTTTRYSFGDDESKLVDHAWYDANSGDKTHDVGQKKPNPWGMYDMHGNVWEWVQDNWHGDYYGAPTDESSWEGSGSSRVFRGGGWGSIAWYCRSALRFYFDPGIRFCFLGFRLLRIS